MREAQHGERPAEQLGARLGMALAAAVRLAIVFVMLGLFATA